MVDKSSLLGLDLKNLKSKLENIEKEFETQMKEVDIKQQNFKKVEDQIEEYLSTKDGIITLNIGGKLYKTKVSTIMSEKDTLFYTYLKKYIDQDQQVPKEIFFDRSFQNFDFIMEYLRTKKYSFKGMNKFIKEDLIEELNYYGFSNLTGSNKKNEIDIGWDQGLSKQGNCTVDTNDNKNLRVHSTSCYCHFVTNKVFTNENFAIELESTVTQTENYYYIGIVNEAYSTSGSCGCCNPANFFYIQCNGTIHINSTTTTETTMAWGASSVTIGMRVLLSEKKLYFYIPDKEEKGPYSLTGNSFRVVAGHCNTGNGQIKITECYEIDI